VRVTPETTMAELQAWLDEHGVTITFQLAPRYPTTILRPVDAELDEAVYKFEKVLFDNVTGHWKINP
jgi:hypothetical protein